MPEIKLKPCPFCGKKVFKITSRESFYEMQDKARDGLAAIRLSCSACELDLWDHSYKIRNYEKRLKRLAGKWNRRAVNETD